VQNLSQAVLSADLTDVDAGGPLIEQETRRKIPLAGGDDAIIDAYLEYKNITGYYEREARDTWATFRSLVDKPLKRCEREDGRELVKYYQEQGSKSATIKKRVGWLRAAVNFAIEERRLDFNPFLKIVPNLKDKLKREKLTEDEVSLIKRNLDDLDANDQLLVHLIATTGMRLAEAYEIGQVVKKKVRVKDGSKWKIVEREAINGDKIEDGIRFVIVGTKTEQSLRRVPFPESILPLLPKKIVKPLFTRSADDPESAASKRLNRFLRDLGITDPAKVGAHSFRHRAQDRLRAAKCPLDIRWEILGHEKKTVAANYGEGHPLPELKQWIDKIGF
jgi:integrase